MNVVAIDNWMDAHKALGYGQGSRGWRPTFCGEVPYYLLRLRNQPAVYDLAVTDHQT